MAVQQRRLGEGEALAARAGSGRGTAAADCTDKRMGGTAASQATAFLEAVMGAGREGECSGSGGGPGEGRQQKRKPEQRTKRRRTRWRRRSSTSDDGGQRQRRRSTSEGNNTDR